ncbi:MAG: asparaginase domain-containing protein [Maricaulaceae bacterium]
MDVLILITGGTLDKVHDTVSEALVFGENDQTQLSSLLQNGRCYHPRCETLFLKDSLNMDADDRTAVLSAVLAAEETDIVITHGTGTMELTAKYLAGKVGDKTVVLTGAMRPFSLGGSDAGFNVGGAVIAAQTLPEGVWGVMNGRVFAAEDISKDTELGRFDI